MMDNINKFSDDAIRKYYVKMNKGVLAEKIDKYVEKSDFTKDEGYLMLVSKQLEDINKKEEIETIRKKLVEQNTYIPKKKTASSQNAVIFSSKPEFVKLLVMLQYWRNLGREALFFRNLVKHVGLEYLQSSCVKCKSQEYLKVSVSNLNYFKIVQILTPQRSSQ